MQSPVLQLGLPDEYTHHGKHEQQLAAVGLDSQGILQQIEARLKGLGLPEASGTLTLGLS